MGRHFILCVDDEVIILESLKMELQRSGNFDDVVIETAGSGIKAIEMIRKIIDGGNEIAVIISDQRMPGMSGDVFLENAHSLAPDTLNILLTGYSDIEAIKRAVNRASLYRYIPKPWEPHDLLLTVKEAYTKYVQNKIIEEKNRKIENITIAMVAALESANYYNDDETGHHIRRISDLSELIARNISTDEMFIKRIKLYSSLHDIGKVGIRKEVLLKPAKLDQKEFEEVKQHVLIGFRMLDNDEIDDMAKNIVLYHHEKWNGSGYLKGMRGDAIPLEARIVAIADVFDALINPRVYKPAFSLEKSVNILKEQRGIHFDPDLLDIFLDHIDQVAITEQPVVNNN